MMPDKLESKVKECLRDTEIPFDPSGWDRLERDLDAKGAKTSFKFNVNWKYSLNTLLVVVAASALVWGIVRTSQWIASDTGTEPVTSSQQPKVSGTPVKQMPSLSLSSQQPVTTAPENKEVVVQQFFPTQVYNIQYPVYNPSYAQPTNDQVALETENVDGEFSELVKNRPVIHNPLMRQLILGDLNASLKDKQSGMQAAGSEMKLSPEEMQLFKEITITRGRGELIFGDQIDPRKGIVGKSKEGDSVKTIFFGQEKPAVIDPNQFPTDTTKAQKEQPK